jgi:DNA-binding transcriptional MerR regulator
MSKKAYYKIQDVAEITRLKPKTIREYCSRKLIPHIKLYGNVLFDPDEIEAWIQASKVNVIRQIPLKDNKEVC